MKSTYDKDKLKEIFNLEDGWLDSDSIGFNRSLKPLAEIQLQALSEIAPNPRLEATLLGNILARWKFKNLHVEVMLGFNEDFLGDISIMATDNKLNRSEYIPDTIINFQRILNILKKYKERKTLKVYSSPGDGEYNLSLNRFVE